MVLANLSDGATCRFDLTDRSQVRDLNSILKSGSVKALSLLFNTVQTVLPTPRHCKSALVFGAQLVSDKKGDPIGEKIFVQADNTRVSLTATFKSKLVRCDVTRIGRMKYDPTGLCTMQTGKSEAR